jgi:hypothetical protein
MKAVVDNDILLKGSCYGLLPMLLATIPRSGAVGILGASRFVVPKMIVRNQLLKNLDVAVAHFAAMVAENEVVEPSADEQHMAALLESTAQQMALNLDAGESQLVAVLVSRVLPCMLTGDKRAIASLEALLDSDLGLLFISGKIRCLEQLVADALKMGDVDEIRRAICGEPSVDKTLCICFSCNSSESHSKDAVEGLASYIADLRRRAARVLST